MLKYIVFLFLFSFIVFTTKGNIIISTQCSVAEGFPLSIKDSNTIVFCDSTEQEVIKIATNLFCSDIDMITGIKPKLTHCIDSLTDYAVIIGSIDSKLIKQLVNAGKLNTDSLNGAWERFIIKTIDNPMAGVKKALVIVGSDRRGAAYGVFELSKAIGVSPWYWWADVTPKKKDSLVLCELDYISKEPTVKYRGIFINDEDWGLDEWADYTFEAPLGIGPKTYEKVFELLLRLKANFIWPAMHSCTKPFYSLSENKVLADKYAIVMGTSHHEPLLYNTHEWPYASEQWNTFTNMETVIGVLKERVAEVGQYENVYTMGIRGTEDTPMEGGSTLDEKTAKLEEVIDRQRGLLEQYVNPEIHKVPQVFWPYKEVLDIYNNNMEMPDDITLGWVDDNHGYIRQLSTPEEQARSGGSGVYYHLSYLGPPNDFLWLASTQPALIASEMKKAAALGANHVWIFNVGDIKPAEMLSNYCLDLAWDYNKWGTHNVREYLLEWFSTTFGNEFAEEITDAYTKYFQLAQAAKPEHVNKVNFSDSEIEKRLTSYQEISNTIKSVYSKIPTELKDAFFETVYYPVICSGLMNEKFLYATKSYRAAIKEDSNALEYAAKATSAFNAIKTNTNYYNTQIKNGKWNKIISANIRTQDVYAMPPVASNTDLTREYVKFPGVDLAKGTFVAPMKYENGVIYGTNPATQTTTTGGIARFTFDLPESKTAEIHFYARTPSDKEDSWFVTINGQQVVQNDVRTGDYFAWIKVWTGTLKNGGNTIIINQREPNTQIAAIKIVEPDLLKYSDNYVPEPDTVIPAWKFSTMHNARGYKWEIIEGLSTSEKAVTNLPFTIPSVDNVMEAPYLEQEVGLQDTSFTLEVRCVPTRKLYDGRDLRIGVSLNGESPKIFSIDLAASGPTWSNSVLQGYVKKLVHYTSSHKSVKIRLYALDPGVIFDQILIYNGYVKADTSTNITTSIEGVNLNQDIKVFPNPCTDYLTISLNNYYEGELDVKLIDLMGRSSLHRKIQINADNLISFPVSKLNNGFYFLTVKSESFFITKKIMKN